MAAVNATSIWNTSDYLTFVSNINSASNGLLINSVLIGIFLLSYFLMKRYDSVTAALSASATTAIVCLVIGGIGIASPNYALVGAVVLIGVVIYALITG